MTIEMNDDILYNDNVAREHILEKKERERVGAAMVQIQYTNAQTDRQTNDVRFHLE